MTLTPQMQRRIRERWEELKPLMTIHLRRYGHDPIGQLKSLEALHAYRVGRLLLSGVRLRKIRKWNWDDPLRTDEEFNCCQRIAVDNLRKRNRTVPPKGLAKFRH